MDIAEAIAKKLGVKQRVSQNAWDGLPNIGISLSPLIAAILGFGMNYAAYEAELYRADISAVPKGQMEAGLSWDGPGACVKKNSAPTGN